MRDTTFRSLIWRLAATTALAAPLPALAQTPAQPAAEADGGIEDIVVTAQRREESVQDVPIAITAFSALELERRNISSALDLVQYVPNFVGHNNTGLATANAYYIRGVGDTESLASKDPPVGTYVDELFFSRQSANNFSFFDVERVEVLRGPQGTLFGRNTTGGAINVIVRKPQAEIGGFAEAGYGRFDQVTARASLDLPVSPKLLTKFSGYYSDDNGYVKNITTGETTNDERGYGGRVAVRALPSDSLTWDGALTLMHAAGANLINFDCNPAAPTQCDGRFASTGLRKNNGGANQYPTLVIATGKGSLPLGNVTNTKIAASNFGLDLGESAQVNLISGYIRTKQRYNLDFFDGRAAPAFVFVNDPATSRPTANSNLSPGTIAGGPVRGLAGGFAIAARTDSEQHTEELKLTGDFADKLIEYVGGFYYYREVNKSDFADISTSATTGIATLLADRFLRNTTKAYAGYLQVDGNVADWLKLTAGVRYTDERKTYAFSDNRPVCQTAPLLATCIDSRNFTAVDIDLNAATPPVVIPLTQRQKIWTPRFAVNVKPNDDILLFASATRGFKSGGQSARSTSVRFLLPFDPEKVWSYELGAKMDLLDRRLRVNITGFRADTQDLQGGSAFITQLAGGAQQLSFVTRNFANFRNQGLEWEITAVPVERLTLNLSGGYQDAKYILDAGRVDAYGTLSATAQLGECRAALAGSVSPRGDARAAAARAQSSCGNGVVTPTGTVAKPPRTPQLTLAAGASYEIDAGPVFVTPSVNLVYSSSQEVGTSNTNFYRNAAGVINITGDGQFVTGSFSKVHTVINSSIGVATADRLWNASLECSNCFNTAYPQSTLSNFSYLNQPATWMVKLRRKF